MSSLNFPCARPVCEGRSRRRKSQGSALLFSLMALVVLMLGAVALVRSVSTGSLILGNLGFKQDATASADRATREAITWLSTNGSSLGADVTASGYYATNLDGLDATGQQVAATDANYASRALVNWDGDGCAYASSGTYATCKAASSAITVQDSTARYLITRLCLTAGDPSVAGNSCLRPLTSSATEAAKRGALNYGDYARFEGTSGPYYRIIVRVVGARNTVSFTETIVHF
jgi:type IV pilus assembly protein PilX